MSAFSAHLTRRWDTLAFLYFIPVMSTERLAYFNSEKVNPFYESVAVLIFAHLNVPAENGRRYSFPNVFIATELSNIASGLHLLTIMSVNADSPLKRWHSLASRFLTCRFPLHTHASFGADSAR